MHPMSLHISEPIRRLIVFCLLVLGLMVVLTSRHPAAAQTPTIDIIIRFIGSDNPLIPASDGNLYGTYGISDWRLYRITPSNSWTPLYDIGDVESRGVIQASDGYLYGATNTGGVGTGSIFRAGTDGSAYQTLYSLTGASGEYPTFSPIQGNDGYLYGTCEYGGASNNGTVFKASTDGSSFQTLYSFSALNSGVNADGGYPYGPLIQASNGYLYGTTEQGGANGAGVLFQISTDGSFSTLHAFGGSSNDGASPESGVTEGSDGNLYGVTPGGGAGGGVVYRITTSGTMTILHNFTGGSDGANPAASLTNGSDGNLYGTTNSGGAYEVGTLFQVTTSGTFTTLCSFTFGSGFTSLTQAGNGYLYGVMPNPDYPFGAGVVYLVYGIYPVPSLQSLSLSSCNAGSPAFILTVKGAFFQPFSTVNWNGKPLTTSYVSGTELQATVPASLIASPGKATVTVVTGAGGGTSGKKTFTVLLTTLKLHSANLTRNSDGSYTAKLTIDNLGYETAPNVSVTSSTLGVASTSTALPISVGSIGGGAGGSVPLTYPASAGASGTKVTLKVSGTFTGGKFSGSLKVTLP